MKDGRARVKDTCFVRVVESFTTALVHTLIHGNTVAPYHPDNVGCLLIDLFSESNVR